MAENKDPWVIASGMVQAFTKDGVKQPAVKVGDANGHQVFNLTIKTFAKGAFLDVTIWASDYPQAGGIQEGAALFMEGTLKSRTHNDKVYQSVTAQRLVAVNPMVRSERQVVNQVAAAPMAAAPVAVAAPVAEVAVAAAPAAVAAAPSEDQPFSF